MLNGRKKIKRIYKLKKIKKSITIILASVVSLLFISCGEIVDTWYITAFDGYVKDGNFTIDGDDTIKYRYLEDGRYKFDVNPVGVIGFRCGIFEDGGLYNWMNMSAESGSEVVNPITTIIYQTKKKDYSFDYDTLYSKIKQIFNNITPNRLEEDYIDKNNIELAKFAQLIYILNVTGSDLRAFLECIVNPRGSSCPYSTSDMPLNVSSFWDGDSAPYTNHKSTVAYIAYYVAPNPDIEAFVKKAVEISADADELEGQLKSLKEIAQPSGSDPTCNY